jgi:hypothetical protein
MHVAKSVLLLLGGSSAGIAFVISCGDNWHLEVDAAIDARKTADAAPGCDCPAAEPPLAGRFVISSQLQTIPGNDYGLQSAACPGHRGFLLAGSCTTDVSSPIRNVTLQQSGIYDEPPTAWACYFRNNDPEPVTIRVSLVCLMPPP